jgi:hypothetical protein
VQVNTDRDVSNFYNGEDVSNLNKADRVHLKQRRRLKIAITHTHLHAHTPRHARRYILFVICTERERERGESSKLRCGFVPLMNLQWDSTESPFTYTS